jgi:hypothetical protein
VTLVPREATLRPGLNRRASCGADGKFEILSVRPGDYYAFALPADDYFAPDETLDDELLKQSIPVTVPDNGVATIAVRLIHR